MNKYAEVTSKCVANLCCSTCTICCDSAERGYITCITHHMLEDKNILECPRWDECLLPNIHLHNCTIKGTQNTLVSVQWCGTLCSPIRWWCFFCGARILAIVIFISMVGFTWHGARDPIPILSSQVADIGTATRMCKQEKSNISLDIVRSESGYMWKQIGYDSDICQYVCKLVHSVLLKSYRM